jgi:3-oxoacyl-[acyl-carrier-protein] synthase II
MTTVRAGAGRRGSRDVAIVGVAVTSAYGRGVDALMTGVLSGRNEFRPVSRFDVSQRRITVAALLPGDPDLGTEIVSVIAAAGRDAGIRLDGAPVFLALHGDAAAARCAPSDRSDHGPATFAGAIAAAAGLGVPRTYTSACVAASTAVADAAALIARGEADRIVVAAGYLVEPDQFALFDAGRALADDGAVRPFSAHRRGLLLGDGVAAVVLEATSVAAARGARVLGRLAGWGRAGDAYHPCQPAPSGAGLARAIEAALGRASVTPERIGYVNAHGSGTLASDWAESAALRSALGSIAATVPVSSSKSLHGQALEASALVELIVTVHALRDGKLPVIAGFVGPDQDCPLNLILDGPAPVVSGYALSLNSAFGGANTALVVATP